MKMKAKGKVVTVYEDPITKTRIEGKAKVRAVEIDDGDDLVYCEVRFLDRYGDTLGRWIDRAQLEAPPSA